MEKQYNEELVMHLVKALESALPAGMSVLVGGSPELSEKEAMQIICDLSAKTCGRGVSVQPGRTGQQSVCLGDLMASIRGYGENQEWIPDDEEEVCSSCHSCFHYRNGECDGVGNEDEDCVFDDGEEEESDFGYAWYIRKAYGYQHLVEKHFGSLEELMASIREYHIPFECIGIDYDDEKGCHTIRNPERTYYEDEDEDCPLDEEPSANMERIRELLEEVAELMNGL